MAVVGEVAGSGGVGLGGAADVAFVHGTGATPADLVLEWDLDNDGDFDQPIEDRTGDLFTAETMTGRDWPSQLTGKAGPGSFKASLDNTSTDYSVFNEASPLNQVPNSLDTGRKLRIRTSEAADPDPALLARDRFRQADGPLTTAETGQTWEQPGPTFQIVDGVATATTLGAGHVAVVDTGSAEHYVQVTSGVNSVIGDNDNAVGLIYRYVDVDNLSIFQVRADSPGYFKLFELIDIVAGSPTVVTSFAQSFYERTTIAAHAHGDLVDLYIEGRRFVTGQPAINPTATKAGIWGQWAPGTASRAPELARFDAWGSATARTDGILWTGDVADIVPDSVPGDQRTASLTGEGWLAKLATHSIRFPGLPRGHFGRVALGKTLADSNLLHPPGQFIGPFTAPPTSAIGLDESDAIEVARLFEDHEGAFLHETQEGWLDFEGPTARTTRAVSAVFSDEPGAQFGYETFKLLNWRREIFNQVDLGLGHMPPEAILAHGAANHGALTVIDFFVDGPFVQAGDLLIGFATCSGATGTTLTWLVPPGWVHLTADKPLVTNPASAGNNYRIYAKVADGTEDGFINIANASANLAFVSQVWSLRGWFGDIQQGVVLGDESFDSDPPPVSPGWAPQASRIIAIRWGRGGDATVADWSRQIFDGFFGGFEDLQDDTAGRNVCIQTADKTVAAESVTDPAPFDGDFSGFVDIVTRTLAIRGATLAPAEPSGVTRLVLNDRASQDRHNAIRNYVLPPSLYQAADEDDATARGEALLSQYGRARPVIEITFTATVSAAHRAQAARRRVGDKIRLVASGDAGMGINRDMFIENIRHSVSDGGKLWKVTWQLSPA